MKILILIGAIALCALLGVLLLYSGGQEGESTSGGELSPPPLPGDRVKALAPPALPDEVGEAEDKDNLSSLFGESGEIEPPPLPL